MNVHLRDPIAAAIHEIRSPLGLVAMAAGAAAEASDDPTVRRQCESIVHTTNRMLRVTSTLFALACDKRGQRPQPFRPAEIAESITSDMTALGAQVSLDIDPASRDVELQGYAVQLEGLLQSLLVNAFEHGEPGEVVHLRVFGGQGRLEIHIENRIASNPHHRGLGLGNLIADRLAAELDGAINRVVDGPRYRAELRIPLIPEDAVPPQQFPVMAASPVQTVSRGQSRLSS